MNFDFLPNLARAQQATIIVVTHALSIAGKTDKAFRLSGGSLVTK